MRDYAKVEPKMWHGATMKALRRCPEGVIVGMYLMTSPQSNMLGLFSQPVQIGRASCRERVSSPV